MSRAASTLLLLILTIMQIGCGGRASINGWQNRLEQQAHTEGDMAFLRATSFANGPSHFDIIGNSSPDKSTDVKGVLMGRQMIQDSPWLVFLVGSVKNRQVQDVRVAMVSDVAGDDDRQWLMSSEDERSTEFYRKFRDSAWRKRHPNRSDAPINALDFPGEDDIFRLELAGNTVSVIEERSGARWTLVLPRTRTAMTEATPTLISRGSF